MFNGERSSPGRRRHSSDGSSQNSTGQPSVDSVESEMMPKCDVNQTFARFREQFIQTQRSLEKIASWITFEEPKDPQVYFVKIKGPKETSYEGGVYKVKIFLPLIFPLQPPSISFVTRIYHPNVDILGRIGPNCIPNWNADWVGLANVLLSVRNLMISPDINSPLCTKIGRDFTYNPIDAIETARKWNSFYAQ